MVKLQVYIADDCWTCAESQRLVAVMQPLFPDVVMELLDVNAGGYPDNVFAVPTYVLNGRIVSLGNPTQDELCQKLLAAQQGEKTAVSPLTPIPVSLPCSNS